MLGEKKIGIVFFEVCPRWARQAGLDPTGAVKKLDDFGYMLCRLGSAGTLETVDWSAAEEVDSENWIAIAPWI